jgi:hypothetical protein
MYVSNLILMLPSLRVLDDCVVLKALFSFASSMTVISFAQLAWTVTENWKSVDKETKYYCIEVALILKERHTEMTKVEEMSCLSMTDSVSQGPKEEAKPRNADSKTKDSELTEFEVEYCFPTMDFISPGPKNDMKQRKVQLPRRVTHAFEDQPSRQYLSVHAPMGIFPVAQEQDNMNSCNNSRILVMDMYHQYQHTQVATIPNTSTIWGNESLDCTHIKTRQPMPSVFIQEMIPRLSMPIMTGRTMSQTGTHHQHVQHKFSAITNASQRASISNMMTLLGRDPMPIEICCSGEQPSPKNRWYSAPLCQSSSELDRSMRIYNIQELDITDSIIFGIWWLSKVQETNKF